MSESRKSSAEAVRVRFEVAESVDMKKAIIRGRKLYDAMFGYRGPKASRFKGKPTNAIVDKDPKRTIRRLSNSNLIKTNMHEGNTMAANTKFAALAARVIGTLSVPAFRATMQCHAVG